MRYRVALGLVLRELRKNQKLTLRAVSEKAPVALGYLSEIERGTKEVSSELLEDVARSLGYQLYEVILKTGFLMAGDSIPDTLESLLDEHAELMVVSK